MAHGRLPAPAPQIPVLTGMPVSGMAYLDRPAEAGYFIFPDLSVRHEGKYKLSFNLYEETKDAKDADANPPKSPKVLPIVRAADADSSFDWRMEVKSQAFTVFSAKKFPGLAESTALSKTVAEQGCRVRIRRDVRMRRREGKDSGDMTEPADDEYTRPERPITPADHDLRRAMDHSHDKFDARAPRSDTSRRESLDYNASYPQPYTPSSMSSHSSVPPGYPQYTGVSSTHYQQPAGPFTQSLSNPHNESNAMDYHRAGTYRPLPSQYGAAYRSPFSQHAIPPSRDRDVQDSESRRPSLASLGSCSMPPRILPHTAEHHKYAPHNPYPSRHVSPTVRSPVDLPPFKNVDTNHERSPTGPLAPVSRIMSQEVGPQGVIPQGFPILVAAATPPVAEEPRGSGKRSFGQVFRTATHAQPLFNHRRPGCTDEQDSVDEEDEEDEEFCMARLKMQYKRADGSNYSRPLPSVQ